MREVGGSQVRLFHSKLPLDCLLLSCAPWKFFHTCLSRSETRTTPTLWTRRWFARFQWRPRWSWRLRSWTLSWEWKLWRTKPCVNYTQIVFRLLNKPIWRQILCPFFWGLGGIWFWSLAETFGDSPKHFYILMLPLQLFFYLSFFFRSKTTSLEALAEASAALPTCLTCCCCQGNTVNPGLPKNPANPAQPQVLEFKQFWVLGYLNS